MPSRFHIGARVVVAYRTSLNEPPPGSIGVTVIHSDQPDRIGVDFAPFSNFASMFPGLNSLGGTLTGPTGRTMLDAQLEALDESETGYADFTGYEVGDIVISTDSHQSLPAGQVGMIMRDRSISSVLCFFPYWEGGHHGGDYPWTSAQDRRYRKMYNVVKTALKVIDRNGVEACVAMWDRIGVPDGQADRARVLRNPEPVAEPTPAPEGPTVWGEPTRGSVFGFDAAIAEPVRFRPSRSIGEMLRPEPREANFAPGDVVNRQGRDFIVLRVSPSGRRVTCWSSEITLQGGYSSLAGNEQERARLYEPEELQRLHRYGEEFANHVLSRLRLYNQSTQVTDNAGNVFPIGTRVRRNQRMGDFGYDSVPSGLLGVIVSRRDLIGNLEYGIDFHTTDLGRHTLGGLLPRNTGYFLKADHFEVDYSREGHAEVFGDARAVLNVPSVMNDIWNRYGDGDTRPTPTAAGVVELPTLAGFLADIREGRVALSDVPAQVTEESRSIIGREATMLTVTDQMREVGMHAGMRGSVISASTRNVTLDLSRHTLNYGIASWTFTKTEVEIMGPEVKPPPIRGIKTGDRVVVRHETKEGPPVGTEGTVLRSRGGDSFDVDFYPYRWRYGTDLGNGNERSGRTINKKYLIALDEPEEKEIKAFYLMGFKDGKSWIMEDQPGFDSGKEASDFAKELAKKLGHKVQSRKSSPPDTEWRARETKRLIDGTYKPMPKSWNLDVIKDHFLHMAVKNPGMVAYTPNPDYGEQDRQVFARPGSYVKKFYPSLTPNDIARYSAIAACDGQLEITNDSAEMVKIYRMGQTGKAPDSCMKYDFVAGHHGHRLPIHPIAVYGEGELALAYLRQGSDKIIARCLVWPEKKIFTRAYGDIAKIIAILEAEGYKRDNFIDAKIKRVKVPSIGESVYVVPYIDDCDSVQGNPKGLAVVDDGEHLLIKPEGYGASAARTEGIISIERKWQLKAKDSMVACPKCSKPMFADEAEPVITQYAGDGQTYSTTGWCARCASNRAYMCHGLGVRVSSDITRYRKGRGMGYISQIFFDREGAYICAISGAAYYGGGPESVRVTLADGRTASYQHFNASGFTCHGNKKKYPRHDDRTGDQLFEVINGYSYSTEYLKEHPEVRKNNKGITQVEKSEKKKKTAASVNPHPYFSSGSITGRSTEVYNTYSAAHAPEDLVRMMRESMDQMNTTIRPTIVRGLTQAEPIPVLTPAPAQVPPPSPVEDYAFDLDDYFGDDTTTEL